jgi:hypothetical protein
MSDFDEIRSPFLRKVLERGGISDDEVTSLLIVERYHRRPEPTNSVIALMLAAIDKELPIEAAVVRREIDLGRALTDKELKQEIMEHRAAMPQNAA